MNEDKAYMIGATGLFPTRHRPPIQRISASAGVHIIVAGLCVLLFAGCTSAAKAPAVDQDKLKQFVARGYDSGIDYSTKTIRSSLRSGNKILPVSITEPGRQGKYPLVIYLPGLGGSSDSAPDLRSAWAKSGFVIVSLQPLSDDAQVWSSDAARSGDFSYIKHERYSSKAVSDRLDMLSGLVNELERAVSSGAPGLGSIDLSRVALAGFDVGAYSAMIVAGESAPGISPPTLPVKVSAVIALSPYADFSGVDFAVRYRDIGVPVLSVTSDTDSDDLGSDTPSLHRAPFQYMPEGQKYLLAVAGATHADIGNERAMEVARGKGKTGQSGIPNLTENSPGNGTGQRGEHARHEGNGSRPSSALGNTTSPTKRAMIQAAIQQVSIAFLNAYIKDDKYSLEWLSHQAKPWIDEVGQLQQK
jgi:dienelactone hydrolase